MGGHSESLSIKMIGPTSSRASKRATRTLKHSTRSRHVMNIGMGTDRSIARFTAARKRDRSPSEPIASNVRRTTAHHSDRPCRNHGESASGAPQCSSKDGYVRHRPWLGRVARSWRGGGELKPSIAPVRGAGFSDVDALARVNGTGTELLSRSARSQNCSPWAH